VTSTPLISPRDIGLPAKFSTWRPNQWEYIELGATSNKRFVVHSAPTGAGKSIIAVAHAILTGGRSVYLTSTKGLQDQSSTDFSPCGMADLRGRQNYRCPRGGSCADGRLMGCKDTSCEYLATRDTFLKSSLTISNYSCYFANVMHGEGMGEIDCLILDECHAVVEELSAALEIRLNHAANSPVYQSLSITPPYQSPISAWKSWAKRAMVILQEELQAKKRSGVGNNELKYMRILDTLLKNVSRIATIEDTWIVDEQSVAAEVLFSPVWPTDYAEKILFRGIKHILLVSATVVPKTLDLLGVPESDYLFLSHTHTFPIYRSPVYLFGATKIDFRSTPADLQQLVGRMDTLISRRLDRKGIIHPTSYDRQMFIKAHSDYRDIMLTPKGQGLANGLVEFRESPPPCILNSPAVTTGLDFAGSQCEYQLLVKVPFVPMQSPVMKARVEADPEYPMYLTAQTLVQTCGRAMRSEKDQCENFLLDKNANWFLKPPAWTGGGPGIGRNMGGYRHLFPEWFINQLVWPKGPPTPPTRLEDAA
jgi:Rad3-related DNA helicase